MCVFAHFVLGQHNQTSLYFDGTVHHRRYVAHLLILAALKHSFQSQWESVVIQKVKKETGRYSDTP